MTEHISELIDRRLSDPIGNLVAAALDSGIPEQLVRDAVERGLENGVYEHTHDEPSPGDNEPRYSDEVAMAEKK